MKLGKYTTIDDVVCHTTSADDSGVLSNTHSSKTAKGGAATHYAQARNSETIFSRSDFGEQEPVWVGHRRTHQAWRIPIARGLPSRWRSGRSLSPGFVACRGRFPAALDQS